MKTSAPISLIQDTARLAECPFWHEAEKALYFVDIPTGRMWRFDPAKKEASLFHTGPQIGGITLQEDGSWLLFREEDIARLDPSGRVTASRPVSLPGSQRFNDVIAASAGRVFAGTIGDDSTSGGVYRFDPDGSERLLFRGTGCSNGLAFTPDGRFLYWTCTTTRTIYRFDYEGKSGEISGRIPFYICAPQEGLPDGLTLDISGRLWSARWGTGLVIVLSSEGEKLHEISVPESNITSLAWGGDSLSDLYITSAREGGTPGRHDLFVVPHAGEGRLEYRSRLPMPKDPRPR
jgi:sugar lactone lactonase YvrE